MTYDMVQVPVALLLSRAVPSVAKLAWMVARLRLAAVQAGERRPAITEAMSRPGMLQGLAQLASAGWDPTNPIEGTPTVPIPAALLLNRKLGIEARVLYGLLLLTPGFQHPCGQFTHAGLAALAGTSPKTAAKAAEELAAAEWIKLERKNRRAPVHFQLTFPGLDRQTDALARMQKRLERASFLGEQLMREYLTLLVDSANYEDDAAPGFLANPRTDERLQLDRFYPPNVAWEFNGPQHYHPTERFSAEEVAKQQERDYIKLGICARRRITLIIVEPHDLTLLGMLAKVGTLLPVRDTAGLELLVDYLEQESHEYRRRVMRLYG